MYSTFLYGGSSSAVNVNGKGIAVDSSGSAYITGSTSTYTTTSDFPTTAGAFQSTNIGGLDVIVTKLNAAGTALVYSTLFGGGGDDAGNAIAVDSSGSAYISGYTQSSEFHIPRRIQ